MILGTGIDLVAMGRFERTCLHNPLVSFVSNNFTPAEIAYCEADGGEKRLERYAVRWAAKEAFVKALARANIFNPRIIAVPDFRNIEVKRDLEGVPYFELHGEVEDGARKLGVCRMFLSLSHDGDTAIAQVILEGE